MSKEIKVGDLAVVRWSAPIHVNRGVVEVRVVQLFGKCPIYARDVSGEGDWYDPAWLRHLNWIEKLFYKPKD